MSVIKFPRLRPAPNPKPAPERERPWLPEGMSAAEFTFREAIDNFRSAKVSSSLTAITEQRDAGLVNVAHAWLWAVTDAGLMDAVTARVLFAELVQAAGAWETGA